MSRIAEALSYWEILQDSYSSSEWKVQKLDMFCLVKDQNAIDIY